MECIKTMHENMLIKKYEQKWHMVVFLFETKNNDKNLEKVLSMRTSFEFKLCYVHIMVSYLKYM